MRSLVILVIAGTLSACSGMMLGGGSSAPSSASQTADATLSSRVRAKYAADPVLGKQAITVQARSGLVSLTGTVATYAVREAAEKTAMAVDGVKGVDNRISVNYTK
jgi:hyperosmotically inducible periplasmic protein